MNPKTQSVSAVDLLLEARTKRKTIEKVPSELLPADQTTSYKLQEMMVNRLLANACGETIGYKVACTSKLAQDLLKVDGPFYGCLLSSTSFADGAELITDQFFFRCIEAEFSFEISKDLPNRPIVEDELSDYIGAILPSVEIVDSRYADWIKVDAKLHIVDNACHGAWVEGKRFTNWKKIDLAKQPVELWVNGELKRQGSGAAVLGNPLNVVAWLANALHGNGKHLKAGDLISTGITTDVYFASTGDQITADFGEIGQVHLSFSKA
jgi:2-keto-4-pentenoate hydratase